MVGIRIPLGRLVLNRQAFQTFKIALESATTRLIPSGMCLRFSLSVHDFVRDIRASSFHRLCPPQIARSFARLIRLALHERRDGGKSRGCRHMQVVRINTRESSSTAARLIHSVTLELERLNTDESEIHARRRTIRRYLEGNRTVRHDPS